MFACIGCIAFLYAQQRPHYTQYIQNPYIINPALTGIENYTDIKLSMRDQWIGFPGAPRTIYATVHGPIGKKDFKTTPTSFAVPGENPRGKSYWESYTASEPHHGIGAQFFSYKTGYISRISGMISYAYHLGLTPTMNLSAGFSAGLNTFTLDGSKIELANPSDPAIGGVSAQLNRIKPELNAGLWLYSDRIFAGLSAQQIIPQKLSLTDNRLRGSSLIPHLFFTTGYRFLMTEDINVLPSVMVRYISGLPVFADLNAKFLYQDRFWLGGNYRIREGVAAMAGVNISSLFNVTYSYDTYFNRQLNYLLPYMQRGTHELVLGFMFGNKYGDLCPKNVW
jgi:type IX secretion system PorP/SprF family membrane protein